MYEKLKIQGAASASGGGGGSRGDSNGAECTYCERPKSGVFCNSCSHYVGGMRVRMKCSKHPKEMFLMDLVKCPRCKSDNLSEGKRAESERAVFETPPKTPSAPIPVAASARRTVFETPPKTPPAPIPVAASVPRLVSSSFEPRQADERPPAKKKLCPTLFEDRGNEMDVDDTDDLNRNVTSLTITRNMTSTASGPVQRTINIIAPTRPPQPAPTQLEIPRASLNYGKTAPAPSPPREARVRARSQIRLPGFEDEALAAQQRAAQRARGGHQSSTPSLQVLQTQPSTPSLQVLQPQPSTPSLQVLQPQPSTPSRLVLQPPSSGRQPFELPPDNINCPVCSRPASYVLCLMCGFYASGMRKYFACARHNNSGGLKQCPECKEDQLDEG